MNSIEELKRCQFCGGDNGYYEIEKVHRSLFYTWAGAPNGSSEDVTEWAGKRKYCANCHRILPRKMDKEVEE